MTDRASTTRSSTTSRPSAACSPRPTSSTSSRAASRAPRSCTRSPTRSSCRTSSVLTRGNTLKHKVLLLGGPNTYLPFLQECWRLRIPETWDERGYDYPKDVPIEELIFVPENAQYYAALGAVLYGLHEAADVGVFKGVDGARASTSRNGRKARLGETRGPAARRRRTSELDDVPRSSTRSRSSTPTTLEPGKTCRGVIGLDGGSTSSQGRPRRRETASILKKAYQLSKGNPIQDTKELLAQLRKCVDRPGREARGHRLRRHRLRGRRARGVRRRRREHRRDRRAHDERVHFFGDVDVICDIGGQDIKVLFMKNGDIENFRLSNSCSAGNGMLLQAMADQFGVPVTEYADVAFKARARAEVQLRLRRLPRHRSRELPEGGLLEGGAARRPRAGAAEERLAVRRADPAHGGARARSSCSRAARSTTSRPSRRRSTTSRSACPTPRCSCTRTRAKPARSARRWRRCASSSAAARSTFIGIDAAIDLEYTSKNDEETRLPLLPEQLQAHVHRHQDARRPDRRYISGFSCEKGTVESEEAMLALSEERKKMPKQFPNIVDYEAKQAFRHFYEPAPMPERRRAGRRRRGRAKRFFGAVRREDGDQRPFQRASPECWASARRRARRHPARAQHLLDGAVLPHVLRGARRRRSRTSSSATRRPKRCGSRAASTARSIRATRRKVAQAHIHNLLFHQHTERASRSSTSSSPILTHVPNFVDDMMDNATLPDRRRRAGRHEGGVHEGGRLLRRARHRVPRSGAVVRRADAAWRSACSRRWGPRLGITEDENDLACRRGAGRRSTSFDDDLQEKGRAILETVEAENRVAILMIGRPYHSDPGLNHGIPEEFQVLGYPILSMRSIPQGSDASSIATSTRTSRRGGSRRRSRSTTCGRRTTRSTARRRCGRRSSRRTTRTSSCSICRASSAATTRRPTASSTRSSRRRQDAVRGAPRHRREQAGRLDQDPRQDLRAHAQAPRGAARGHGARAATSSTFRIDEKRLELLELKRQQLAARKQQDPALEKMIDETEAKVAAYSKRVEADRAVNPAARGGRRSRPDSDGHQEARQRSTKLSRAFNSDGGLTVETIDNDQTDTRKTTPRSRRQGERRHRRRGRAQEVRGEQRQRSASSRQGALGDDMPTTFTGGEARAHHAPHRRPHDGARPLPPGRAPRHRLQRPGDRRARQRRRSSSARSSATAASATRRTSPSATW